jgi:hypothetical protein
MMPWPTDPNSSSHMKKMLPTSILAGVLLATSCTNKHGVDNATPVTPLRLERKVITELFGPDCGLRDTLRADCAEVRLRYPALAAGPDACRTSVESWAEDFLRTMVYGGVAPDERVPLVEAIGAFFRNQSAAAAEFSGFPAYHLVETSDTVLHNDGRFLTLRMDGYANTGGNHPHASAALATWEVATGRRLALADMVTDLSALSVLAEQRFREVKADVFRPESDGGWGFDFSEQQPFRLAANVGMTAEGLHFCYVPYEVASYAFGFTEFVLDWQELDALLTPTIQEYGSLSAHPDSQ